MIDINSTEVLVLPFNVVKVDQLRTTALIAGGFTIPPIVPVIILSVDATISVQVPDGQYTQQEIDAIVSILNAVVLDPTRNDLTENQQEDNDLSNKLDHAKDDIDTINNPGGLRDQINATTTGLDDRLLTNAVWNALPTNVAGAHQKADLLRQVLKDTLALIDNHLQVSLHGARADKYELKYIQDRLDE